MKKILIPIIFVFLSNCSLISSLFKDNTNINEQKAKKLILDEEDLSNYMGYQSALLYGDIEKAEILIKKVISKRPNFLEPYLDLINIYVFKKNIREAKEVLQQVEEFAMENEQFLLAKANILLLENNLNEAIPVLKKIINLNPEKENVYLILANIYYQNKDYDNALKILKSLLKVNPTSFFANLYLGKIYETMEDNKKAAEYYEKALKEREEDELLMNLDRVYDKLGERLKSIDVLEKFLSLNPDFPKIRERLGILYVGENNYRKALEHFDILVKQFPDNIDLNLKASFIAIEGKLYDKAEVFLKNVLNKEPENQKALYFYGLLYKDQKRWKEALTYFEKIKDNEYLKSAKLYMAICYEKLKEKDKAKDLLLELWDKDPDDEIGYFLALYYKSSKEYNEALKIIDKIQPSSKEILQRLVYLKSEILIKMGDFNSGITLVKQILEKEPDNPDALNFVGYSYVEKGINLDEAEKMIKKALEIKTDDPYITDSLAWLYYVKGDYEKAFMYQSKVLEKINDDPTILEHMGDICRALNRFDEALRYYKEALNYDPEDVESILKKLKELENK
jgi:tetratricopeptide (TPR) repeat protein